MTITIMLYITYKLDPVIQSINQSNFYSANIPSVARLSGATSESALNSKINEAVPQCQQVIGHAVVYGGKARSKRYQSIKQTSIAPISPAKPGSMARRPNQCSTAKSRKQFFNINRPWGLMVAMGERPSQRDVSSDISER